MILTPALTFGLILATLYGSLFHLWQGGDGRRLLFYLLSSWLGFALGQLIADMLSIGALRVGQLHMLTGTFGAWVGLAATRTLLPGTQQE